MEVRKPTLIVGLKDLTTMFASASTVTRCDGGQYHLFMVLRFYLRQGGYVFVVLCLSVCLFVCLLATLRKNFPTDLHEIFREGWLRVSEKMIKF